MSTVDEKKKNLKKGKRTMGDYEYQFMLLKPKVAKRALYACLVLATIVISLSLFLAR